MHARPNLVYAQGSIGSIGHLAMAMFLKRAALEMPGVSYQGNAPALNDVIAGHVPTGSWVGLRRVSGVRYRSKSCRRWPPSSATAIDPMYGPAVRRKRFSRSVGFSVLHQCIRPCMGLLLSSGFRAVIFLSCFLDRVSLFDWNPVSSSRPAVLQSRRAQELSRLAVAPTFPSALRLPGHTLTAPSTAARSMRSR
jgi:hypothetical protein